MATVTGFTAERMLAMEAATIVDGDVVGDNLILTKHDGSTVDAGSVRGPTGSPGVTQGEMDVLIDDNMPVCSVLDYLGTVVPSAKWLKMEGQTIVNGQTLYPEFWSKIPAGMKSGANIIMPDSRGRVSAGFDSTQTEFDTIGETGGEKSHLLIVSEMPSHNHLQNAHNHTASAGFQSNDHAHAINVYTGGFIDDFGGDPVLGPYGLPGYQFVVQQVGGGSLGIQTFPANNIITSTPYTDPVSINMAHHHAVNGNTDGANANHTHAVTNTASTATNQAAGGGAAHNNLQPYITLLKIIKVA